LTPRRTLVGHGHISEKMDRRVLECWYLSEPYIEGNTGEPILFG
jgi:hypothetical protein